MREPGRNPSFLSKVPNLPAAPPVQQQRLGCYAGFPVQPHWPGIACGTSALDMHQQPGQLNVSIPQAVHNPDPVLSKNPPRVRR
jgi:hypothetical protein